jgi:excisionase family DNA binding protein
LVGAKLEALAMSRLLTVAEVAERLNLCRWTVRKLAQHGKLPAVRLVPGKLLFREDDVEEAVRRASQPAASVPVPAGASGVA